MRMSNQQILEKAIQKAIDGGWHGRLDKTVISGTWVVAGGLHIKLDGAPPKEVLYDHSFAKTLWGAETLSPNYGDMEMLNEPDYAWEHHLQQMVIAPDPIKYLGDNT